MKDHEMTSTLHPTEDELILHFYGESQPDDETVLDAHLRSCPACAALWADLCDTLKLTDSARVPEPDETFEQKMWARIQPALPTEDRPGASAGSTAGRLLRFRVRTPLRVAMGIAAVAAIVALVVASGRVGRTDRSSRTAASTASTASTPADHAARERVLLTALDDHFQRSELLLVEVMNAEQSGTTELGFERQTADDLLASGRLYRATAQQNGNVRLAQMLEELELVLVEIARSPDRMDQRDLSSLRARIENDDLVFKVRALTKQIEGRQKTLATE
jgi:hypothetical protein